MTLNLTDLRRHAPSMMDPRGEMFGQVMAHDLVERNWHPKGGRHGLAGTWLR